MSDMIGRCVEAAFAADWRFGAKLHPEDQRKVVAAIIAAMREPTAEMIEAEPEDDGEFDKTNSVAHARAFWQAMIDAAINSSPNRPNSEKPTAIEAQTSNSQPR